MDAGFVSSEFDAARGFVCERMAGRITAADARRFDVQFDAVLATCPDDSHIRVLADIREASPADTDARQAIMAHVKRPEIDRYAIWGIPAHREFFMHAYFRVVGIRNYKVFRTEQEAVRWLQEGT